MNVLLVGNYVPDDQRSMLRFAAMLARGLARAGDTVSLSSPGPALHRYWPFSGEISKWLGHVDKYLLYPRVLERAAREAGVMHVLDHSNAPYLQGPAEGRSVITCHDVIALRAGLGLIPEHRPRWTGRRLQRWILASLPRARRVVCVSENTRRELLELVPALADRASVVPNALDAGFAPRPLDECRQALITRRLPARYLLHVGGNQFYKNRAGVVEIFAALTRTPGWEGELVLAGAPVSEQLWRRLAELNLTFRVREVRKPTPDELTALYGAATALLFPSLYEGFGWPIVEAQACGCPVITSDRPPMTEVAGNAAVLIDPTDPVAAASIIVAALEGAPALRAAGLENAKRFQLSKMIEGYREAYRAATS